MLLLVECVILCLIFTLVILPPQFSNPVSQIMSYPPAIRARVESLPCYNESLGATKQKNVARKTVGTLLLIILLAFVAFYSHKTSFVSAFIHIFILTFTVNLYDLVVLDFLVFPNSKKLVIPGTEDMVSEYKNRVHHIKGAVKGTAISVAASLLSAGLVEVLAMLLG